MHVSSDTELILPLIIKRCDGMRAHTHIRGHKHTAERIAECGANIYLNNSEINWTMQKINQILKLTLLRSDQEN